MRGKRILIVDDEPNVVKSCARILELEGFEVRGVTGGAEAIDLYKSDHFDLALVDLKMPDVDGLQVLAALKEYDADTAVVIFTAYGTKENVVEALRLGACEFLEKPLSAKTLVATVRRILERGNSAAVRGNLRTLSLPSIIQINCRERNRAHLRIRHRGQKGNVFFADGNVVHATLGSQIGEEAIYELLTWEDGDFELEMGVPPPERTITTGWSGLLLEGMRRIDERAAGWNGLDELEEQSDVLQEQPQEVNTMAAKKRSQVLAERLETLLAESADIKAAVIVGRDGLVLASNIPMGGHDATRVGAEGAAVVGLSTRVLKTLECGEPRAVVLEGTDGFIIVTAAGPKAVVMGLTEANVNLGMALLEMRDIAADVAETLG